MSFNPLSVVAWVLANKAQLLGLLIIVISSASAIIKAIELVVAGLVTFFPGLKTAEGKLLGIAAWLDALSKAGWLNAAAWSPRAAGGK